MELELSLSLSSTGNVAALVLSRLAAHPLAACGTAPAFVDAATGESLSFLALRRAALSLAAGLRLGLGLRRGDAVLVLSRSNSLLLPQILLGVLAAGGVVVAADPDATPAEIAAAAHGSGAVMIVAAPEEAGKVAGVGVPLLLTSRPLMDAHRALLSAEELIDGGDPTALQPASEPTTMEPSMADDLAFLAYYYSSSEKASSRRTAAVATMTHADLVAAVARAGCLPPDEEEGRRVCLASLPMCSAHGLPLIALGLPAAGVTTVLVPPPSESESDPRVTRDAVAAHGATDVVATPEAAAALLAAAGGPMATALACNKLATLRRVIVAPTPFSPETREEFRRRLPWVRLMEMEEPALEQAQERGRALMLKQAAAAAAAAVIQYNSQTTEQMLATTNEATSPVRPLKKVQNNILGNILSRSTMSKILRKQPVTSNRQAVSKL